MKQHAPATQRNRQPILDVLNRVLPKQGDILEIASGTGEHAHFFAPHFHPRQWIPSDANPLSLDSIKEWQKECPTDNMQKPLPLDVTVPSWFNNTQLDVRTAGQITAIVNINMIHISPWQACLGLIQGAKEILNKGGILYLYGPFQINGQHTALSNAEFDQSLRMRNQLWGVRNLDDVIEVANDNGFIFKEKVAMPANNFSIVFEKE